LISGAEAIERLNRVPRPSFAVSAKEGGAFDSVDKSSKIPALRKNCSELHQALGTRKDGALSRVTPTDESSARLDDVAQHIWLRIIPHQVGILFAAVIIQLVGLVILGVLDQQL
jgi:hypothetical protein